MNSKNFSQIPSARARFYPESRIGGFSYADGGIAFFSQINAILRPSDQVLDFGAGRGEYIIDDVIDYRRNLSILRGKCAHVEGCDVDDAVLGNPFLDHAVVVNRGGRLPYPDNVFDIVFSRFVFEHLDNPIPVASELLRVVRPGGVIAAITPNKYGYIAIGGSLVPNRLHARTLSRLQPKRKSIDIFPTVYKLNCQRDLRTAFGEAADLSIIYFSGEPAYTFGSPLVYRATKLLHKFLPDRLRPLLIVFIVK